jgi:hypothetical protein
MIFLSYRHLVIFPDSEIFPVKAMSPEKGNATIRPENAVTGNRQQFFKIFENLDFLQNKNGYYCFMSYESMKNRDAPGDGTPRAASRLSWRR